MRFVCVQSESCGYNHETRVASDTFTLEELQAQYTAWRSQEIADCRTRLAAASRQTPDAAILEHRQREMQYAEARPATTPLLQWAAGARAGEWCRSHDEVLYFCVPEEYSEETQQEHFRPL